MLSTYVIFAIFIFETFYLDEIMLSIISLLACGSMHNARPLEKGQNAVGLSFGGPMVNFAEKNIPLPNAIVQVKQGMGTSSSHSWDIQYGLNLTAIAFDQIGAQLGGSYLISPQQGISPAWSVATTMYAYNNFISTDNAYGKGMWVANQTETTLSWNWKTHLLYTGFSQTTDVKRPSLLLSPFVGIAFSDGDRQSKPSSFQIELRHYAAGRSPNIGFVDWYDPTSSGAMGLQLTYAYLFTSKNRGGSTKQQSVDSKKEGEQ